MAGQLVLVACRLQHRKPIKNDGRPCHSGLRATQEPDQVEARPEAQAAAERQHVLSRSQTADFAAPEHPTRHIQQLCQRRV